VSTSEQASRFPRPERQLRTTTKTYLLVALGGMIGALARHGVTVASGDLLGHEAPGTFIANVTGAFLLGFVSTVTAEKIRMSLDVRRFIGVGILGSYTTFSVLSYQTLDLIEDGDLLLAAANACGSLIAGLVAVMLGVKLARK
jgi:fluoride exporter